MSLLALFVLLGLVSKYGDFLTLTRLQYLSCNGCALNVGRTDLDAVVGTDAENLVKGYFGILLGVKLLNIDNVAVLYLVLLTAGNDYCVHVFTYLNYSLAIGGGKLAYSIIIYTAP